MLSPTEFFPGTFAQAQHLSLILPRNEYEHVAIVGLHEGAPAAVFLSGQFAFRFFSSAGNTNWKGLIVQGVSIEVDESSLFDPDAAGTPIGSIVSSGSQLAIMANSERLHGLSAVVLHEGLVPAADQKVGFAHWQVVLGEGISKRTLWRAQPKQAPPNR